ncbi:MAG: DUF3108 domain-containing protein [Gemmatimonadota bacterium]|jgi:hypothetical protein
MRLPAPLHIRSVAFIAPAAFIAVVGATVPGPPTVGRTPDGTSRVDSIPVTPLPPREGMYHPFRPGERLTYEAHVGLFGDVGEGVLEILADSIRGTPVYNLRLGLRASALFGAITVDDLFQSWLDPRTMRALRFEKRQDEPKTHDDQAFDFDIENMTWRRVGEGTDGSVETGPLPTDHPLDEISFIYYVRALPLDVGDHYVLNDYFKESGNPLVLDVVRRERVKVPAGTFQTIVVRPTIRTKGLFGQGGEAELYFTDDALHVLVMLKSRLPVLRTLEFRLKSFKMGY